MHLLQSYKVYMDPNLKELKEKYMNPHLQLEILPLLSITEKSCEQKISKD